MNFLLNLQATRPDLLWRRGTGGIYDATLPDGRRVQVWIEEEGYAGAFGRGRSVRAWSLRDLLNLLIAG